MDQLSLSTHNTNFCWVHWLIRFTHVLFRMTRNYNMGFSERLSDSNRSRVVRFILFHDGNAGVLHLNESSLASLEGAAQR
jgi:hypothetical protein